MSTPPTPQDLLRALLQARGVKSPDDLRGNLPNSIRTVQRWVKEGWPQNVAAAIDLLTEAGYLGEPADPDSPAMKRGQARRLAIEIADRMEELVKRL